MLCNGNNDFYPTPAHLARKMLDKVKFEEVSTILEPSAGKGDLIEMVKQKECGLYGYKFDIDAIEKDANLRHILNGKEYRTVHDDFLTYETFKQYDLINYEPSIFGRLQTHFKGFGDAKTERGTDSLFAERRNNKKSF